MASLLSLTGSEGGHADVDFEVMDADLDDPAVVAELVAAIREAVAEVREQEGSS